MFHMMPKGRVRREWPQENKIFTKQFKINGLERSGGADLRGPTWTMQTPKPFPCSVALVSFCSGAFPCSVALFFCFWACLWVAQHDLSEDVEYLLK